MAQKVAMQKGGHAHLPVEWAQGVSSEIGYGCRLI